MKNLRFFPATLFFACLVLTGCSFASDADVQQNYVLPVPVFKAGKLSSPMHLEVLPVDVASGLDTTRIVLIDKGVQVNYLADSRWAEPLPQMLQFLWIQSLRQSGLASSVSSDTDGEKADRLIHITASAFNAVRNDDGSILVRVQYQVKIISPLTHVVLSSEDSSVAQTVRSLSMENVMETFKTANAQAMNDLSKKLVADLMPPIGRPTPKN